jgi:photosystem II stability/assembly factor-like uncharacterized protein
MSYILSASDYQWNVSEKWDYNPMAGHFISALDSSTYICASSGSGLIYYRMIEKTTDYGKTWDTLFFEDITDKGYPEVANYFFTDIKYIDKNNIIALCGYRSLLKSEDMGITWKESKLSDESFTYNKISAKDSIVFIAGDVDRYAKSTDMGNTWEILEPQYSIDSLEIYEKIKVGKPVFIQDKIYKSIFFFDKANFVSNFKNYIHNVYLESSDNGETWTQFYTNRKVELSEYFVVDEESIFTQTAEYTFKEVLVKNSKDEIDTVYTATPHYKIVKINRESGEMIVLADSNSMKMNRLNSLRKFGNIICLNMPSGAYISTDNGETWEEEVKMKNFSNRAPFEKVERVSPSKGIALGIGFFATLEPATSVSEHNPLTSEIAVYPNPAGKNDEITIDIKAHEAGKYTLQLTALDGSECNIKQTETLAAGLNRVSLNLSTELISGIYILSIYKEGQFVAAHKVVIQ